VALKRAATMETFGLVKDDAGLDWAKSHDIYNTYFKATLPVGKWVGIVRLDPKDSQNTTAIPSSLSVLDMSITNEKDLIGVMGDHENDVCMYLWGLVQHLRPLTVLYITHVGHEAEDGAERQRVKRRAVGTVSPGLTLGAPPAFRAPATWSHPGGAAAVAANPYYDSLEDDASITLAQAAAILGPMGVGYINGNAMVQMQSTLTIDGVQSAPIWCTLDPGADSFGRLHGNVFDKFESFNQGCFVVSAARLALSSAVAVTFTVTLVKFAPLPAGHHVEVYSPDLIVLQHATVAGRGIPLIPNGIMNQFSTILQLPAHTMFKVRWLIINTATNVIVQQSSLFNINLRR
jgi:hypothetical protein